MTFKPGKYRTRDGREAVVLCDDAPGSWPLVGYISAAGINSAPQSWMPNGRVGGGSWKADNPSDLMPPEPEHKILFVTMDEAGNCIFDQARDGDDARTGLRATACARVVLTPGQFDDENTPDPYTKGWNEALEEATALFTNITDKGDIRALKRSAP